ncbi:MAG: 23S rRNA pseudouridine(955/2504/2580) synthase RluC [Pantoea sp. Brub]|nr:23S rRNA pseudouridine(955/2504/2580) synthase RluC [Pantoea sp. Brub]
MERKYFNVQVVIITIQNVDQRVDNFLFFKFKTVPKSMIYRMLRKGKILINKKKVVPAYKLQIGDIVRIPPIYCNEKNQNNSSTKLINFNFLNKNIVYEDDYLIVMNKPSGIAVHGGSKLTVNLIDSLRASRPNAYFLELVHRLDRDTSGILLIAKKRSVLRFLHEQLRNKLIQKQYLTLVHGYWPSSLQKIQVPLLKTSSKFGKYIISINIKGKLSETHFKIQERFEKLTLISAKLITGYTHQIRVHTSHLGYPITFDKRYGNTTLDQEMLHTGLNRLFLHACHINFLHPKTKKLVNFNASLDQKLQSCLFKLRQNNVAK